MTQKTPFFYASEWHNGSCSCTYGEQIRAHIRPLHICAECFQADPSIMQDVAQLWQESKAFAERVDWFKQTANDLRNKIRFAFQAICSKAILVQQKGVSCNVYIAQVTPFLSIVEKQFFVSSPCSPAFIKALQQSARDKKVHFIHQLI
jgi:hypothetical protein